MATHQVSNTLNSIAKCINNHQKDAATIVIRQGGDLTFKLVQTETVIDDSGNSIDQDSGVIAYFVVSRQVMKNSSSYFRALLDGPFMEEGHHTVALRDDTLVSLELWLRCLHGAFTEESYNIPIEEVFHTIQFGFKHDLNIEKLEQWFDMYWKLLQEKKDELDLDLYKQLLFPCKICDSISAFQKVTKYLTWHGKGHVEEMNPTWYLDLRCPKGVISKYSHNRIHCWNVFAGPS
jgi:hypothetical protein